MTLQQLAYLVAVAECGSITDAAERLFISQPSLSAAIHNLEKEMGVTAFVRSNKGVAVTREGEELLSFARMLLEQADIMQEHFGAGRRRDPRFCVSCQHYSFAVNAFVDVVQQYDADRYSFILRETQTGEIIDDVSSGRSELGLLYLCESNESVLSKLLRKSYSVLQDDFFQAMRNAGYTDVERGERGSSEEHLTVTQFKVEREQERLEQLTAQTQQKEQQAASLEKKIEKIQKQQIAVQEVEQIEPHTVPFSSKVMLDRSEYENLAVAAKKFYVQERKESKLQKALEAALKMISELKAKVAALTAELAEYKSVRGQLNTAGLEQQNELLRNKLHRYETVIERNGLWNLFRPNRKIDHMIQEEHR